MEEVVIENGVRSRILYDQYRRLRTEVFGPERYDINGDRWDDLPDTNFVYWKHGDKLVAGIRYINRREGSGLVLPYEERYGLSTARLLPHLTLEAMNYSELSGLCMQQNLRGNIQYLGTKMQATAFTAMHLGGKCDFVIISSLPKNLGPLLTAAGEIKLNGYARHDCSANTNGRTTVIFASKRGHQMAPPEVLDSGQAETLTSLRMRLTLQKKDRVARG